MLVWPCSIFKSFVMLAAVRSCGERVRPVCYVMPFGHSSCCLRRLVASEPAVTSCPLTLCCLTLVRCVREQCTRVLFLGHSSCRRLRLVASLLLRHVRCIRNQCTCILFIVICHCLSQCNDTWFYSKKCLV